MRLSYAAISLLPLLVAADKSFGAVTVRTGTKFQFGAISTHDGEVHINDGEANIQWVLKDDGSLWDATSNKYLVFNERGELTTSDEPEKQFALTDGYLTYKPSSSGFYACPNNQDKYLLSNRECQGGTNLAVFTVDVKDVENKDDHKEDDHKEDEHKEDDHKEEQQDDHKEEQQDDHKEEDNSPPPFEQKDGFGLVAIHSGSQFQNQAIKKVDAHPHVFSVGGSDGRDLTLSLKGDGTLVDQDGRGIFVGDNGDVGNVDPWGEQHPTGGFAVKDGNLYFNNEQSFFACPGGENQFSLTVKGWDGCTGLQLKVFQ